MVALVPIATLKDVTVKRRGKTILGPISHGLESAGFTIVLGPNGAGKTTLLNALHGVERLSNGSVTWTSPDHASYKDQAFVFQRPIMLRRTVRQNLAYPLQLLGHNKNEIETEVMDWVGRVGLNGVLDHFAPRLSGGEKQKLALARALIHKPKVLFLDEPCANLDGRSTREIETVLSEVNAAGTSVIMTTHDLGQARRLASDVVFLLNGQIHETCLAPHVFKAPKTPEAKAFFQGDIVE